MATETRRNPNAEQPTNGSLLRLFDDTRKRLVETGTRNRLVHVNRSNTRGNVINIVNERSDDVHSILSTGKAMRFLAIGRDKDDASDAVRLADAGEVGFDIDRYTDTQLETRLGPDALQKKLLKIAREAQTAEEESGVNILYLAMGFLTWLETKTSSTIREAPLVLLPVQLTRNQRTSTYDIRFKEEDVVTNLPLQQRLHDDFGISLPELEIDEQWMPSAYFAQVEMAVANHSAWKVDRDGMQLGFFSFSKLLMYRDLAPDAWPNGAIAEHPLTRGLLFEGFESAPALIGPLERLDDVLQPENIFHVVDADASQAVVIEEARRGRNLVVQGPPGTGKSQTITNIIAAAVKDGKRVLFVAEKMAALSVVHDRLVKVGLRDVCLELHSRTANKKVVLAELARTLTASGAVPLLPGAPIALKETRDALNALASELHHPLGETGETPFSVLALQSKYLGLGMPAPSISGQSLSKMSAEQTANLLDAIEKYGTALATEGRPCLHPFAGVNNLELQPVDLSRLSQSIESASAAVAQFMKTLESATTALGVGVPFTRASTAPIVKTLDGLTGLPTHSSDIAAKMFSSTNLTRLQQGIEAGATWQAARESADKLFTAAAFISPSLTLMRGAIAAGTQSLFTRWGSAYRNASRELSGLLRSTLPKSANERLHLVDMLVEVQSLRSKWALDESYCAQTLGDEWRGERTEFTRLLPVVFWCQKVSVTPLASRPEMFIAVAENPMRLKELQGEVIETASKAGTTTEELIARLSIDPIVLGDTASANHDLNRVANWLKVLSSSIDRYPGWVSLQKSYLIVANAGIPELANRMRDDGLPPNAAAIEVRYARAESIWKLARDSSPRLQSIGQENRHYLVDSFAGLERSRLKENVTSIVAGHLAQVPQGAMGEMKVVRGEIGKKRGHIALRKLFLNAGTAMQRIKPVMLMSPISVAQYIPPGALTFDLLVIDEASQVRPEDALGAIARAKQIVVVGDQKQLPPSSFFDRLLDDDAQGDLDDEESDELLGPAAKIGEMESVLSLCEARGLAGRMLQWHYRSRDPSLIQVSNAEFYENKLILPPSPLEKDPAFGLCLTRVDGIYDKGGKRDNRIEGNAIVRRVAEHARQHPSVSLGIVTFSSAQRNLITELLELHRRTDPELDGFLREGRSEDVFVKNIENVQGDERDVILVSVCYGPVVAGGRLSSMSFGPVNGDGGERRLNVLFTRARLKCEVFVSFNPSDIDPSKAIRSGTRILKRYLEFANGAPLNSIVPTGEAAESPFEEDVADVIRSLGYLADPQVGSVGFRIDMGVRHPDRPGIYLLAVECDGATYHSALWARERDRLRQDVLEHLGWQFHRIWSTDWFYNRKAEIERLHVALDNARQLAESGIKIEGANHHQSAPKSSQSMTAPIQIEIPEIAAIQMPPYKRYFTAMGNQDPHDMPLHVLSDLTIRIVREEGPIHIEEAARRVATCFGKEKAGTRILTATKKALEAAKAKDIDLLSDGTFWFLRAHVDEPPVRDRSLETGATVKAASISMLEIKAVLKIVRDENAGGDDADLVRSAARLLGFKRVGADLSERIAAGLGGEA